MTTKSLPSESHLLIKRKEIGKKIRDWRKRKGYSQENLANIMKVDRSTISKVETGKFSFSVDYLLTFGWFLGFDISLDEFADDSSQIKK